MDFDSAPSTLHEKAVYILEGRTFFVEKYDHQERRAHVREAEVDYYTDAITYTKVKILDRFEEEPAARRAPHPRRGPRHLAGGGLQEDQVPHQRERGLGRAADARERDAHHRLLADHARARSCARCPSRGEERRDGVVALSYTLGQMAALFLMCDRHDLGVALGDNGQGEARIERGLRAAGARGPSARCPGDDYEPQIFIYDNYPGGIGLSEPLYRLHDRLLAESRGADRGLPVPRRLPLVRGPGGRGGQPRQGSRAGHPGRARGMTTALRHRGRRDTQRLLGLAPSVVRSLRPLRLLCVLCVDRPCIGSARGVRGRAGDRAGRRSAAHRLQRRRCAWTRGATRRAGERVAALGLVDERAAGAS